MGVGQCPGPTLLATCYERQSKYRYRMGNHAPLYAIALLGIASLYFTSTLIDLAKDVRALRDFQARPNHIIRPIESYTLVGDDHPKRLPVPEKLVKMIVQESTHYGISEPEAETEWLWTATIGDGHVRIGKEKRMFAVAMFHQLHCLRGIRNAMDKGWNSISPARQTHILHCYNYLRQWTLCSADVTLEPGDFTKRNFTTQRHGATHTCIDWKPAYDYMSDKWMEWEEYRVDHN
ncbi:hypothetical protein BDQ12DRAFT_625246, partial [Crucibulum laeve]